MPKENYHGGLQSLDPFYPDGYVSTDQDRQQIIAQKQRYAARVNSINYKFPLIHLIYLFETIVQPSYLSLQV